MTVRARRRLREDGERRARVEVQRPDEPAREARRGDERRAGLRQAPPPRRCSAEPGASTVGSTARSRRRSRRSARRRESTRRITLTPSSTSRSRSKRSSPARRCSTRSPATSAARRRAARPRRSSARTSSRRSTGISNPVWIAAQAMTTDFATSFEPKSMIKMVGYDMSEGGREGGLRAGRVSGPRTWTSSSSTIASQRTSYSLTRRSASAGRGGREVHLGRGQHVRRQVGRDNPSGGLLSKGHPLGATGARAVHRARLAASRSGGEAPGEGRQGRAAAQLGARGCVRRDDVSPRLGFGVWQTARGDSDRPLAGLGARRGVAPPNSPSTRRSLGKGRLKHRLPTPLLRAETGQRAPRCGFRVGQHSSLAECDRYDDVLPRYERVDGQRRRLATTAP